MRDKGKFKNGEMGQWGNRVDRLGLFRVIFKLKAPWGSTRAPRVVFGAAPKTVPVPGIRVIPEFRSSPFSRKELATCHIRLGSHKAQVRCPAFAFFVRSVVQFRATVPLKMTRHSLRLNMSNDQLLQSKAAELPETIAAEVLDFLEFVLAKQQTALDSRRSEVSRFKGALMGQLSTTREFSAGKADEIRREG